MKVHHFSFPLAMKKGLSSHIGNSNKYKQFIALDIRNCYVLVATPQPIRSLHLDLVLRYRSIITSLLHTSPRVSPRTARVESSKSYRGNLRFHVMGRGFSTRRLVAFHDTWHFHETTRGISTK